METKSAVYHIEKKLNPKRFQRRDKKDNLCRISNSHFWDLLSHIDDDYMTDFEVWNFRRLYEAQLYSNAAQTVGAVGISVGLSVFAGAGGISGIMGKSFHFRIPFTFFFASFLMLQS